MPLWMVRIGQYGEYERRFLETNRIYATWEEVQRDLNEFQSKQELRDYLHEIYPEDSNARVINYSGQLWPFAKEIQKGDCVVILSKLKPAIHFAEITARNKG